MSESVPSILHIRKRHAVKFILVNQQARTSPKTRKPQMRTYLSYWCLRGQMRAPEGRQLVCLLVGSRNDMA